MIIILTLSNTEIVVVNSNTFNEKNYPKKEEKRTTCSFRNYSLYIIFYLDSKKLHIIGFV